MSSNNSLVLQSMEDMYDQEMDSLAWQMKVLKHEFSMFEQLFGSPKRVIVNTSFIDSVVLAARAGIEMSPNVQVKSTRIITKPYISKHAC